MSLLVKKDLEEQYAMLETEIEEDKKKKRYKTNSFLY